MKTSLALLLLCALLSPVTADAKCKYKKDTDTQVEMKLIQWKSKMTKAINGIMGKSGDDYYLIVVVNSVGKRFAFDDDTPLIFHLENDETLTLIPSAPEEARRTILGLALNNKKSETVFQLDESTYETFRDRGIYAIDMHYKHKGEPGVLNFDVNEKKRALTKEYAGCLIEYDTTPN